jgi:hypothetical protein
MSRGHPTHPASSVSSGSWRTEVPWESSIHNEFGCLHCGGETEMAKITKKKKKKENLSSDQNPRKMT